MSPTTRKSPSKRRSYAPIFAALGDETRLALIARLSAGESYSIAQLTDGTQLTRQAVTKHLRVLEDVHLVHCVRIGRESRYELDPTPLRLASDYVQEASRQWDRSLARLKAFVEK